jgi:hypothetical protein
MGGELDRLTSHAPSSKLSFAYLKMALEEPPSSPGVGNFQTTSSPRLVHAAKNFDPSTHVSPKRITFFR